MFTKRPKLHVIIHPRSTALAALTWRLTCAENVSGQ